MIEYNFINMTKGSIFYKKDINNTSDTTYFNDRYVVIDYDLFDVFLVKLDFHRNIPITFVKRVSYETLNKEYEVDNIYGD